MLDLRGEGVPVDGRGQHQTVRRLQLTRDVVEVVAAEGAGPLAAVAGAAVAAPAEGQKRRVKPHHAASLLLERGGERVRHLCGVALSARTARQQNDFLCHVVIPPVM